MKRVFQTIIIVLLVFTISGCNKNENNDKPELLIYCGITMVKPISKIAKIIEKNENCKITISQGGSEDLYQSLLYSKTGDLYLPGSSWYREKHLPEGLLLDYVDVGFNQIAMMVQKGNPKNITGDLNLLCDKKYSVVIGNHETSSVGKLSKKILENANIYEKVFINSATIASDSRDINKYLKNKISDIILNWRATGFFEENREFIDVITLPETVALKNRILLNKVVYTKHPELVKKFMDYAVSTEGKDIFRYYGFLE